MHVTAMFFFAEVRAFFPRKTAAFKSQVRLTCQPIGTRAELKKEAITPLVPARAHLMEEFGINIFMAERSEYRFG